MTASPAPIIGNRYQLIRALGSGQGGEVWEVHDLIQGGTAALKVIDPATLPPGGPWPEAAILTGLRGERILSIRNAEIYAGQPVIVTDVAHGGTLESQATPTGVPWPGAIRWMRQACVGIQRIHDIGLLHCDIKPGNLFLDANRDVLVGDLGLATLKPPAGPSHNFNSPTTVAPEVAAARRIERLNGGVLQPGMNSVRSDVYSLAATTYWLITGQPPHPPPATGTWEDWLDLIATTQPPPLADLAPHLPQDLRQRIEIGLHPDPAQRYASAAEYSQALGGIASRSRIWVRTDEHAGHLRCYRGAKPGSRDATICAVPTPGTTKAEVVAHRGTVRAASACSKPASTQPSQLARRLRVAFRDID